MNLKGYILKNKKDYRANNQNKNNQKRRSRNKYDIGILDG